MTKVEFSNQLKWHLCATTEPVDGHKVLTVSFKYPEPTFTTARKALDGWDCEWTGEPMDGVDENLEPPVFWSYLTPPQFSVEVIKPEVLPNHIGPPAESEALPNHIGKPAESVHLQGHISSE